MKYDLYGYGKDGYNAAGFNVDGNHRNGKKYGPDGYDEQGYDAEGFNAEGKHRDTDTEYDLYGYDKDDYDEGGYDSAGNHRDDFPALASGNTDPNDIWSDGTTMWVSDRRDNKIYAYNMGTKARDEDKEFTLPDGGGNRTYSGIWSDGTTMWVMNADGPAPADIRAYRMSDKGRDSAKDITDIVATGLSTPESIWSNGTTMWTTTANINSLQAYTIASKMRDSDNDFTLSAKFAPKGIWANETTMWVVSRPPSATSKIFAYNRGTKTPGADPPDFDAATLSDAGNANPAGIWSDGTTMWVVDDVADKIFAYDLATQARSPKAE